MDDLVAGDFIGHGAMMKNCELKASVRALTPCSAFLLRKSSIIDLLEKHPGVAIILQEALGRAISASLGFKGKLIVRKKRTDFLKRMRECGISTIQQSTSSPKKYRTGSSNSISAQVSEQILPNTAGKIGPKDVLENSYTKESYLGTQFYQEMTQRYL